MVCGSCIQRLASRLVENHRLDWIDALTRASKGMERYELRHNAMLARQHGSTRMTELGRVMAEIREKSNGKPYSPNPYEVKVLEQLKGNPDYTQNCWGSSGVPPGSKCGIVSCDVLKVGCLATGSCSGTCTCPNPLSNSSEVSNGCSCVQECSTFSPEACPDYATCACNGVCGYDCDEGYSWDGEACVLAGISIPVAMHHYGRINKKIRG